jgi:hypothetical protein
LGHNQNRQLHYLDKPQRHVSVKLNRYKKKTEFLLNLQNKFKHFQVVRLEAQEIIYSVVQIQVMKNYLKVIIKLNFKFSSEYEFK